MVLNSPYRFENGPFSLSSPLQSNALPDSFRLNPAFQQGLIGFFLNYKGAHLRILDGIKAFTRDAGSGGKIRYLWNRLIGSKDKIGTLRCAKIWQGRPLPTFGSYVIIRFLSILLPGWLDWNYDYLGQGAAVGLYILGGLSEGAAKKESLRPDASRKEGDSYLLKRLRVEVANVLQDLDRWGIVKQLESLGLEPFAAVSLEHCLCEARKILGQGGRFYSRMPRDELLQLGPSKYRFPEAWTTLLECLAKRREGSARDDAVGKGQALQLKLVNTKQKLQRMAASAAAARARRRQTADSLRPRCPGCGAKGEYINRKTEFVWFCKACKHKFRSRS